MNDKKKRDLVKILTITIVYLSTNIYCQNIYYRIPQKVSTSKKYIFYLHGKIIEDRGIRPVSEKYGVYEYEKILESFSKKGFQVISEPRIKNTNIVEYAKIVKSQIETLLSVGVPSNNITVIGASKGAAIAVIVSSILKNADLKFVILAICDDSMAEYWKTHEIKLWGSVLYIFDKSDLIAGSCNDYLDLLKSTGLTEFKEIELETGLGHGILYKPTDEWFFPAIEWAKQ